MKQLINIVLIAGLLIGCDSTSEDPVIDYRFFPDPSNEQPIEYSYLALGDSYTIGEGVDENERWPVQFAALMAEENYRVDPPVIIAQTGWTTANLSAGIEAQDLQEEFDLVSLLIGVNNQFQGRSIEEFEEQFRSLLETAIAFAKNKPENVLVLSIPDWGVSPFGSRYERATISAEIDAFNDVKKEITENLEAKFVNITTLSRLALDNPSYIAGDNLHFSGSMYRLWAQEVIDQCFTDD
jgi:lysophospholipase L1-like esterase